MELCEEAKKTVEDNNMCAKLRMSMYGTKAAAQNWQKKVRETMATLGFSIGKASPVLFCHPQRSLKCLVHGDDFVVSGEPVDLVWMRNELWIYHTCKQSSWRVPIQRTSGKRNQEYGSCSTQELLQH